MIQELKCKLFGHLTADDPEYPPRCGIRKCVQCGESRYVPRFPYPEKVEELKQSGFAEAEIRNRILDGDDH